MYHLTALSSSFSSQIDSTSIVLVVRPEHVLTFVCVFVGGWGGGVGGLWLGVAKVSCILRHQGVRLILAYSWARPVIHVAGKGKGGMFFFLLFLHFHSFSSFLPVPLFDLFYYFYLFSPILWETTQNDPQWLTCR